MRHHPRKGGISGALSFAFAIGERRGSRDLQFDMRKAASFLIDFGSGSFFQLMEKNHKCHAVVLMVLLDHWEHMYCAAL